LYLNYENAILIGSGRQHELIMCFYIFQPMK
jgi:hypothetical protein